MRWLVVLLLSCVANLAPREAAAVSIALLPSQPSVNVGDSLTLTLQASALAGAAVGGFDVDVTYDAARFTLIDVTFGGALGDVAAGDQLTDVVSGTGTVSLGSVSLLDPVTLAGSRRIRSPSCRSCSRRRRRAPARSGSAPRCSRTPSARRSRSGARRATSVDVVPEPALALLLALGAGALVRRRRA